MPEQGAGIRQQGIWIGLQGTPLRRAANPQGTGVSLRLQGRLGSLFLTMPCTPGPQQHRLPRTLQLRTRQAGSGRTLHGDNRRSAPEWVSTRHGWTDAEGIAMRDGTHLKRDGLARWRDDSGMTRG